MGVRDCHLAFSSYIQRIRIGDILFADALGMNILILNKRSDAEELLGKRGKIYSSRITNAELRAL